MAPSLHRHYPTSSVLRATPPSHRAEPDRRRCLVEVSQPLPMGLPVLRAQFPFHTCHCQYPGTAVGCIFHSLPLRWQPSPHRLAGRPVHHPFRGVLSIHSRCGLRVRQDTNVSLYTRGFSQFVTSLTAPVASGRSESDRVGFAPTGKAPPLHGARRTPVIMQICVTPLKPDQVISSFGGVWHGDQSPCRVLGEERVVEACSPLNMQICLGKN